MNLASTTTNQVPGTATTTGWTSPGNGKVIDGSSATLGTGSVNTTQTDGTAASTQTGGVNDFGTTTNATGAPNSTLSSTTVSNTSAPTPTVATSSTVSGASDFTNTANTTGAIDTTLATSTYTDAGPGSVTLQPTSGNEGSPTSGYNDFTNPLNANLISGGVMSSANSATFAAGTFGPSQGELRLIGYPSLAAGTIPTSVTLTVRHFESTTSVSQVRVLVENSANTVLCTVNVTPQTNSNPATPFTANIGPAAGGGNNCLTTLANINGVKLDYQVGANTFTSPTFTLDGMSLTVTSAGDTANRTLALSSYTPQLAHPASTTVDAATISIAHEETANANPQLLLSGVNIAAGNAACNTITLTPSTVGATDTFNLLTQLTTNCGISAANVPATINGLTATYVTHLSAVGRTTVNLDAITIALTATDTATPPRSPSRTSHRRCPSLRQM